LFVAVAGVLRNRWKMVGMQMEGRDREGEIVLRTERKAARLAK
jgi:hypothetical protein